VTQYGQPITIFHESYKRRKQVYYYEETKKLFIEQHISLVTDKAASKVMKCRINFVLFLHNLTAQAIFVLRNG
jgi:hypothetical protein